MGTMVPSKNTFILCLIFSCFVCKTVSFSRGDLEKYGPLARVLSSIKCNHDRTLNLDVNAIDVYFYDFQNSKYETFPIEDAAKGILDIEELDKTKKFIIFVGGFKSHINKNSSERIREAFYNVSDTYLLIIDHSTYTQSRKGEFKSYKRAVKYVHYIGKAIGIMLAGLHKGGISSDRLHCIGQSLGAQILAHTGESFFNSIGERISRITGLDPAGPCFSNNFIHEQLRSGVADYVEVYHCNAGGFGSSSVLGDVDFFANKDGRFQPGCGTPLIPGIYDSTKAAKCNHRACLHIWTATVTNPKLFKATKCDNYKRYKKGSCSINDVTIAGFWNPGKATGVYYFDTDDFDVK